MDAFLDYLKIKSVDDLTSNLIKKIESMVRNSKEYRGYLAYIKEHLEIKNCAFFEDIDFVENELTLHFHHLITLYDLVIIVGCKMISELKGDEYLLTFDIAKKVIQEHLDDNIPGAMLSKTIHEMVHAGLKTIPKNSKEVHLGNYKNLINKYHFLLTQKDIDTIKNFLPDEEASELEELWQNLNSQKSI